MGYQAGRPRWIAPDQSAPLIRTADAVTDIGHAVQAIQTWSGAPRVNLTGWATGGHWAGAYAAQYPQNVERLVLYNTLYGGSAHHPLLGRGRHSTILKTPGTSTPPNLAAGA